MESIWTLDSAHSGSVIRLQTLLEKVTGFHVLVLQHNNPLYRNGLIDFLNSNHPQHQQLDLKQFADFSDFETAYNKIAKHATPLHIINLESLDKQQQQTFFRGINYHREHLASVATGMLLIWLTKPLIESMARKAADFWAWREQVFDFSVDNKSAPRQQPGLAHIVNIDAEKKQQRIQEIEDFLATAHADGLIQADLNQELARLYWSIGNYSEAEKNSQLAIKRYDDLDELQNKAISLRDLARIWDRQGETQRALDLLRHNIIPIFQQLKNAGEQAETMGDIADILQARGELDEALRIRKQEQLPVYEKLGDVRSKAVTMGKIADILQARGELGEALTIRQEELPVYEKLGDVRSLLIGRAELALLLWQIDAQTHQQQVQSLLCLALSDAMRLRIPEAQTIEGILQQMGLSCNGVD